MLLLWGLLFLAAAIVTGILAFGGIAIAISFFAKILFFISLVCVLIFVVLMIIERIKARDKDV